MADAHVTQLQVVHAQALAKRHGSALQLTKDGVQLRFTVVRRELIFGDSGTADSGESVSEVRVRGNKRIEADAILARIDTKVGTSIRPGQIASERRPSVDCVLR